MAEVESARPMGKEKIIIFIDELQWFDTAKSGFLRALDLFWNGWASNRRETKLVVCGSATTWMTNKLLGDRGGIHTSSIQGMLSADDLFT